MPETHNIEYKSSWHDDCLKWLCGFANANDNRNLIEQGEGNKGNFYKVYYQEEN